MEQIETFFNANLAFQTLFDRVMNNHKEKENTMYVRNVAFSILKPWDNLINVPWRRWDATYAQLEWEWYLSGDRNPKMVEDRAKIWQTMKDDSGYVNSNYGYWWKRYNQYTNVLNMLKENKNSRRAVIIHFNPEEVETYGKDTPCNIVLNFYVEDNRLCLTIFARSIDLVYGFCNDQYCFSHLLMLAAEEMEVGCGIMTYMITDLHIYSKHWNLKTRKSITK